MRWKILILGAVLICVVVAAVFWDNNSSKQTLADGTVLVLFNPMIGQTNIYTHGTFLSKTIGRFAPTNGLKLGSFKLERPKRNTYWAEGGEIFSAQLQLLPGSPRERTLVSPPPFYRKYRMLISADNDFTNHFTFVKEFNGFTRERDGIFADIWAESFPRDSRQLHFRLEERDSPTSGDWREVATFVLRNPKPAQIKPWQAQKLPRLKLSDDLEVQIGELTVRTERIHPTDIWEQKALLPVRFISHGDIVTNWGIQFGPISDASGNLDYFTFSKVMTNDWMVYEDWRPLDPAKRWLFKVNVALDSNFPVTNLFHFTVPWPLSGTNMTNLGGFAAQISFNYEYLSVALLSKPADTRLTFVSALDDNGTNLDNWTGSWSQHSFYKSLRLEKPARVHVTVAIHKNYPVEFTLQPRFEKSPDQTQSERAQPVQPGK